MLVLPVLTRDDPRLITLLGGVFAVASLVGGVHVSHRVRRRLVPTTHCLWPSVARTVVASAAMAAIVWSVAAVVMESTGGTFGWLTASGAGTVTGIVVYLGVHRWFGSAELTWLIEGARGGSKISAAGSP